MTKENKIKQDTVTTLRNGGHLNLFDKTQNLHIRIQLNSKEKGVCWERWVKRPGATHKDRWVNWNSFLSLKDVVSLRMKMQPN